jgi:hypothetical protein
MYILQFGVPHNPNGWQTARYFLDDYAHPGCEQLKVVYAVSWIEAREQLSAVYN